MPRHTDDQKRALLQARIARLQQQVRRINKREENQVRRQRNHRLIQGGALCENHALANRDSEFARVYVRLLRQYVRPEDRPLFAEIWHALLPPDEATAMLASPAEATPEAAE